MASTGKLTFKNQAKAAAALRQAEDDLARERRRNTRLGDEVKALKVQNERRNKHIDRLLKALEVKDPTKLLRQLEERVEELQLHNPRLIQIEEQLEKAQETIANLKQKEMKATSDELMGAPQHLVDVKELQAELQWEMATRSKMAAESARIANALIRGDATNTTVMEAFRGVQLPLKASQLSQILQIIAASLQ